VGSDVPKSGKACEIAQKKNRDYKYAATVIKLPAKGGDRQVKMYKRADMMAYAKNRT
jgi:hypothetical protein